MASTAAEIQNESNEPATSSNNSNLPREELIETAVKFLKNPKVTGTPLSQTQNFLRRKGLTEEEIQIACDRSGAYALHEQQSVPLVPPPLPSALSHYRPLHLQTGQLTLFDRIRELVHNVAIFSVVAYAVYKIYEKYIAPFLFGKKKKTVQDSVQELDKNLTSSVKELRDNLTSIRIDVDRISRNGESETYQQLQDLRSDLATVKGLLLGRKQFPGVSSNSPVVPPSIPAWQMASVPDSEHEGKEELMEVGSGSGSGSSEPEQCTHKSDSSLEIIYACKDSDSELYRQKSCDEDTDKD